MERRRDLDTDDKNDGDEGGKAGVEEEYEEVEEFEEVEEEEEEEEEEEVVEVEEEEEVIEEEVEEEEEEEEVEEEEEEEEEVEEVEEIEEEEVEEEEVEEVEEEEEEVVEEVEEEEEEVEEEEEEEEEEENDEQEPRLSPTDACKKIGRSNLEVSSQKRQKQDVISELESQVGISHIGVQDASKNREKPEYMLSRDRGRRSGWDIEPGADIKAVDGGDIPGKKRKTRWDTDNSQSIVPARPDSVKKVLPGTDLDSEIRKLHKKLNELTRRLKAHTIRDHRPKSERSPSPQPCYDEKGIQINTRECRLRLKLNTERSVIISALIQKDPNFKKPPPLNNRKRRKRHRESQRFETKLYVPVKEYPNYNFVGLIKGPRGYTVTRMEKETGAKILLRGKGSTVADGTCKPPAVEEDLHVHIVAETQGSLDAAVAMVQKLLVPIEGENELKRHQLRELGKMRSKGCETCSDANHITVACPLTGPTPGSCNTINQANSSANLGRGIFSSLSGQSDPISSAPFMANPAVRDFSSVGSNTAKERDDSTLYVGFLPQFVNDDKLIELFLPFGQLCEAKVIKDKTTGLSKGYGFIKYVNVAFATQAVARMNGFNIGGKTLAVRVAGRPTSTASISSGHGILPKLAPMPTHPGLTAISQGNSGTNRGFAHPESRASSFGSSGFLQHSDPARSFGFSIQTPASSSLISSSITPSSELAQFPGFRNSFDSQNGQYGSRPGSSLFGSYENSFIQRRPPF